MCYTGKCKHEAYDGFCRLGANAPLPCENEFEGWLDDNATITPEDVDNMEKDVDMVEYANSLMRNLFI